MRRRQPAQTFVMAALAMVAMVGALSMVVDAGIYFVIQRQMQTAADAAALAAVWYGACHAQDLDYAYGCQSAPPHSQPANCTVPADYAACTVATDVVNANSGIALSLCAGPNLTPGTIPVTVKAHPGDTLVIPNVNAYAVTVSCDAPHWFGRIFPKEVVPLVLPISISASATIGWRLPNGQVVGGTYLAGATPAPPGPLIARLIVQ